MGDFTAAGALGIVKASGKKVPEDIAIIGFTNSRISTLTDPQMTSVDQFGYEMGIKAAELLIKRLTTGRDYPVQKEVIKTKLIVKGSSSR
jgi:LacI family transcriptional regulator